MSDHYTDRPSQPERPRQEPEIIPPGRGDQRWERGGPNVFVYVDDAGNARRIHMTTPGPFTIILVLLAVGLVAAVILGLILGALFFLIPVAAVTLAGVIAYAYARGFWRRLTRR